MINTERAGHFVESTVESAATFYYQNCLKNAWPIGAFTVKVNV